MKLKVFLAFVFLQLIAVNLVTAQITAEAYATKMDSLASALSEYKKEDEEKVRIMNHYARLCFHNRHFYQGFVTALEARQLSKQLAYEDGIVLYYLTLSAYHMMPDMRNFYQKKAQWHSQVLDEQLRKYNTYAEISTYSMNDQFEVSIDSLDKTLRYFEELGDVEIQANILFGLAIFNFQAGNGDKAADYAENAYALFDTINEPYPLFLISLFKMDDLINNGEVEQASQLELELVELIANQENENTVGLIASTMATNYRNKGRWALAIEYYLKSLDVFNQNYDPKLLGRTHFWLALSYENLNMNSKAEYYYKKSISIIESIKDSSNLYNAYGTLVFPLIALDKFEEARKYMMLALHDTITDDRSYVVARYHDAEGQILQKQQKYEEAIFHFNKAFEEFSKLEYRKWPLPYMKLYLAQCYLNIGDYKKALNEGLECLRLENANDGAKNVIQKVSLLLSEIYEHIGNQELAYAYLKKHNEIRVESDRLDEANQIADAEIRSILDRSQKEIDELEAEKQQKEQESKIQQLWIFSIAGALLSAIILVLLLYRNNKNKQKANAELTEQKEEIQSALDKLESTQSQLIQSEKMASLGELTAGIAHEIQNPLNFVNNFSEVSTELLDEMQEELNMNNPDVAREIAVDLKQNLVKINHHGQRASGIVKGMLEHSRTGDGVKEPTDLNTLADEYLRLAYHGLRAKDNSFNADFQTDFDKALPKVNVVPQDIGRVLLNLINNAFFAVNQKATRHSEQSDESEVYQPEVIVSTKKLEDAIEITVSDNGSGISKEIKDKIFQPFFTTKPTGSGTGLGLSLSYDIVKAHGGELTVESKEDIGTEFIIHLPAV